MRWRPRFVLAKQGFGASYSARVKMNGNLKFHFPSLQISVPFSTDFSSSSTNCVINVFMQKKKKLVLQRTSILLVSWRCPQLFHSRMMKLVVPSSVSYDWLNGRARPCPSNTNTCFYLSQEVSVYRALHHHTATGRKLYATLVYLTTPVSHLMWTPRPLKPCLQKTANSQYLDSIPTCAFYLRN